MKKIVAAALAAIMLASLSGCGKSAEKEADGEYIYGQIESVSGNDVVLLLADYNENAEEEKSDSGSDKDKKEKSEEGEEGEGSKKHSRPDMGDMPEGFDPSYFSGELPEGFDPESFGGKKPERSSGSDDGEKSDKSEKFDKSKFDGKMPEGFDKSDFEGKMPEKFDKSDFEGKMPEGFDKSDFEGKFPEGFEKPDKGERSDKSGDEKKSSHGSSDSKYTLTGDKEEIRIPVGTKVTTSLGVETDFKVLSEGDIIRCSVEKNSSGEEVVTAVQIMEK